MLPIYITLLIFLIAIASIFLLVKWSKNGNRKYLYGKRIYWILGSYLIVLLVATGVYLIIPKQDRVYSEQMSQDNFPNLAELVYEGKSLDNVQMYIKNQWELPYEQNQLHIVGYHEDYADFNVLVSVERKAEDDGVVEATHYKTPIIVEGLDITEYMDPIQVELSGTTLEITGLERVDVKLSTYRNDFPIRQFTEENWWQDWEYAFDRQVLFLRIPKSMQIIDMNEYFDIYYVQE